MRAGKLDRTITIERLTEALDVYGVPVTSWAPIATLRVELVQASTEEFMRRHGASTETVTIFRTRYLAGLTLADRVIYAGTVHDLKELKELGRRHGLELRTLARGMS